VAITPHTRKEDDRLRKELENADLEKFKKAINPVLFPKQSGKKKKQKDS